jgi:hypothetical protein
VDGGVKGFGDLGGGAGVLDGGAVLGDAVDGEAAGVEPGCDDSGVFRESAEAVAELAGGEPLMEAWDAGEWASRRNCWRA